LKGLPETFRGMGSSAGRGWQSLHLDIYSIEPCVEPVALTTSEGYTLQLVQEGKGMMQGVFAGRIVKVPLRAGSLSLLLPNSPLEFIWHEPGILLHLQLTSACIEQFTQKVASSIQLLPRPYFYDSLIEQISKTLTEELSSGSLLGAAYADALAQALALHLLRFYSSAESARASKGLSSEQLKKVDDFIDQFLSCEIRCCDLASLVGMPVTSFARYFKTLTGLPPHQYLIRRRVERAKELLRKGVASVAEVAQMVGFFDQSHLVRHFKASVGVTPKDYGARGA
jgi:AraC family transcriptional regulator